MTETAKPLNIMIMWHMHQPYYKDLLSGRYLLPWVRLHATKDYYEMIRLAEKYPDLKFTFNYVPSLLDQLTDYAQGAKDRHLELTEIPANELKTEEKIEILQTFFSVNWDSMIKPHNRYAQLLEKRGFHVPNEEALNNRLYHFTPQDFLDLQVWSNLVWFGYITKTEDPLIKQLYLKSISFTEEDKLAMLDKQRQITQKIIPLHKKLQDEGQIEISITPMYHPILPLLCDTDSARMAIPTISLPQERFVHPEDAIAQIDRAIGSYRYYFGRDPKGMWPSEGSVSEEALTHIMNAGFTWIGTDEEILGESLKLSSHASYKGGNLQETPLLYQPYEFCNNGKSLKMFFRDHKISDLIGFVYSRWLPHDAITNFNHLLNHKRHNFLNDGDDYVVSIILDGENAWEYYFNNGYDFLSALYDTLRDNPDLKTVIPSQYLAEKQEVSKLARVFSGSWINHNFRIWIGHQEDNTAWDFLYQTRKFLIEHEKDQNVTEEMRQQAWESLFIAEGSDWNWWYGDDHFSGNDEAFDQLYRQHLKNVYHALKKETPSYLDFPIIQPETSKPTLSPVGLVYPTIDGVVTNYYEWIEGGIFECNKMRGAMHQADTILKKLYYGFNMQNLFLRLDTEKKLSIDWLRDKTLHFTFFAPLEVDIVLAFPPETSTKPFIKPQIEVIYSDSGTKQQPQAQATPIEAAINDILEIQIPFDYLGAKENDKIEFAFTINGNSHQIERWPKSNTISCDVPSADFEAECWFV